MPPLSPSQPRVTAVVLTHDRKALLVECLEALLAQTRPVARVLVVDNASSDGTAELLSERGLLDGRGIELHRLERNLGGAGGFSHGVRAAREDGADWLWLMDDDAEPRPDCLERLLAAPAAADPATAALCPRVEDLDGRLQALHRGHLRGRPRPLDAAAYTGPGQPSLGFATFVGLLVRGDVARALDPPLAEFFIWCDDYEYCWRLRERGEIRLVPEAAIVHKDAAASAYLTRRGRLANRVLGWDLRSTRYEAAWRNLCGIRNYVWMKRRHEAQGAVGAAGTVAQFALKALLYDERPLRRLPWLVRYAWHGRRGIFDNPAPEAWAARARRGRA